MARPKMTKYDYLEKYGAVLAELKVGIPYRKIASLYGIGVSTVQRLAKMGLTYGYRDIGE